jgi:hypothetical protein
MAKIIHCCDCKWYFVDNTGTCELGISTGSEVFPACKRFEESEQSIKKGE